MSPKENSADASARFLHGLQRGYRTTAEEIGGDSEAAAEGLRERKKRETRQQISNTATAMFLDHGFDAVRVVDVAEACGVSEKTVYNYFPTKESMLLDREPAMIALVRSTLGPSAPKGSPVEAFTTELVREVHEFAGTNSGGTVESSAFSGVHRFRTLIETTPALRAAQRDMMERITRVATEELASRAGVDPDDPEPGVAAAAIISLWGVMFTSMDRHGSLLGGDIDRVVDAVSEDIWRGARLVDTGLWSFGLEVQGDPDRAQFERAAKAAMDARAQVIEAVRAAKVAWRDLAAHSRDLHGGPWHGDHWDGRGGPPRGGPRRPGGPGQRPDTESLRAARSEMRRAKRDVAEAKREATKAASRVKAVAKKQAKRKPKPSA